MDVICPKCDAAHRVPDEKVPAKGAFLTCKQCSNRIEVRPLAPIAGKRMSPESAKAAPEAGLRKSSTVQSPAPQPPPDDIMGHYPQAAGYDHAKYRFSTLLKPNKKGSYKTRLNKLKMKLLDGVKPTLDRILVSGEQVNCVAAGTAYYPFEMFFGNGWFTTLYNRYVLVATDRRLLALNTDLKYTGVTHYLFQFPLNEIRKVSKGLFGTMVSLKRFRGNKRTYTGIKRSLAVEMHAWITSKAKSNAPVDATAKQCDNLCPACLQPLPVKLAACPECRAAFKTPKKAALRSLLLPGWGDMYLGHHLLGAFEMLGSLLVWIFITTTISSGAPEDIVAAMIMLLFVNGVDALLTLHMAKKGYSLEKKQPIRQLAASTA